MKNTALTHIHESLGAKMVSFAGFSMPVQYSGVKFYALNSTFAFTASQIDLLNDISIPTTNQIDLTCYNLAISGNSEILPDPKIILVV